ncbi:MAG: hypothetical protein AAB225_24575 [Acidobacteriota bacterium]
MNWKTVFVLVACAAAMVAEAPPVTITTIDTENVVFYVVDAFDPTKYGTAPGVVTRPATAHSRFQWLVGIGDIVAVNDKPAKGMWKVRSLASGYTNVYTPGRAIADVAGNCMQDNAFAILQPDGTAVGTIMALGLGGVTLLPGAPTAATVHDLTVLGGTGAFLGARGYAGVVRSAGIRTTSVVEDPANRRINGGGTRRFVVHLIPMTWPEVSTIPTGPAIFHGDDFSPVTAEKPARAGERLIMSVSGLGPVQPNLDPGKPFPAWVSGKEHVVNSPVEVTVNGKAAQVGNAIGWPGQTNVYRVDFRVPDGTAAGTATLGLSVAWINGPEVKFPVR